MWLLPKNLPLPVSSFAPDMEAFISDSNELSQLCEQSLFVRGNFTPSGTFQRKWKRDSWSRFLFGRTLKPSLHGDFEDSWIFWLGGTRADLFRQPANALGATIQDTYTLSSQTPSETCDPATSFSKTSTGISPSDCERSLPTWLSSDTAWKTAVANQRGEYSRRLKSGHLTKGNVSLSSESWASPRASDGEKGGPNQRGSKGDLALPSQVMHQANWPTPAASEARLGYQHPKGSQESLTTVVIKTAGQQGPENSNIPGSPRGSLNADWVEILMGLPPGWTKVETPTASTALGSLETASCQQPSPAPGQSYLNAA